MAKVPMTVSVPQHEDFGLHRMAMEAVENPHRLQVALVVYECAEIRRSVDTGALVPKLRAIRVMPVTDLELAAAQEIYDSVDVALNGMHIHEREYHQVQRVENAFTNPYKVTEDGEQIPYYDKRFDTTPGAIFYDTAQPILTWRYDQSVEVRRRELLGEDADGSAADGAAGES